MTFAFGLDEDKKTTPTKWVDYPDSPAKFKIRGIGYHKYQIAAERKANTIWLQGLDILDIPDNAESSIGLELKSIVHLIEDWQNVSFKDKKGNMELNVPFSVENAVRLVTTGNVGVVIWAFIKDEATRIQEEADAYKNELLGKLEKPTTGKAQTQRKSKTKSQDESDDQT